MSGKREAILSLLEEREIRKLTQRLPGPVQDRLVGLVEAMRVYGMGVPLRSLSKIQNMGLVVGTSQDEDPAVAIIGEEAYDWINALGVLAIAIVGDDGSENEITGTITFVLALAFARWEINGDGHMRNDVIQLARKVELKDRLDRQQEPNGDGNDKEIQYN